MCTLHFRASLYGDAVMASGPDYLALHVCMLVKPHTDTPCTVRLLGSSLSIVATIMRCAGAGERAWWHARAVRGHREGR